MATPEELKQALIDEIELRKQLNRIKQSEKRDIDVEIEQREKVIATLREQNALREKAILAGEAGSDERKAFIDTLRSQLETQGRLTKANREFLQSLEDTSAQIKKTQKDVEKFADLEAGIKEGSAAARDLGKEFGNVAGKLLGVDANWRKTSLTGRLIDSAAKGSDVSQIMSEIGHNIAETLNPLNLFASYMAAITENAKQLIVDIGAATGKLREQIGLGNDYVDLTSELTRTAMDFNMGAAEVADTVADMSNAFSRFSRLNDESQRQLGDTAIQLRKLGVSSADFIRTTETLNRAMGVTVHTAEDIAVEMALVARQIGVTSSRMMQDFATASRTMAVYGDNIQKEFTALSAAAVETGIQVTNLLNIAEGFDTFKQAADKVGSLNALLGGAYFDTVEMVAATEEERIRLLIEGVQATGVAFNQLGRFEQKAIANAAGITDMAEANKLFNTSLSVYDELQMAAQDASIGLNDLSEEGFKSLSWSEKFEILLKKLTPVFDDIVKGLESFAVMLNDLVDSIKETWNSLGPTAKLFFKFLGILLLIAPAVLAISMVIKAFGVVLTPIKGLLAALSTALAGSSAPAAAATISFEALAVALFKITAGIGLAAAGIGVLAAGFSLLFRSVENVDGTKMLQVLGFLTGITALAALIGSLASSGVGLVALASGFAAMAAGIGVLSAALALLPDDEINALGNLFSGISSLTASAAANIYAVGEALSSLDVPEGPGIKKVTTLITKFSEIDPASAASAESVIKNSIELAKLQVDEKNMQFLQKLIDLLTELTKKTEGGSQNAASAVQSMMASQQREVVIEVSGDKLARALIPYLDGRLVGKTVDGRSN